MGNFASDAILGLPKLTKVHRGTTTVVHNTGAGVTITTDVNISSFGIPSIDHAVEKLKGFTINGNSIGQARLFLLSTTTLRVVTYSQNNSYTITVEWEIEVGPSLVVVARVATAHTTGASDWCVSTDETIASVGDTARAEAICNGCGSSSNYWNYSKVKLSAATTLNVKSFATGETTVSVRSLVFKRAS